MSKSVKVWMRARAARLRAVLTAHGAFSGTPAKHGAVMLSHFKHPLCSSFKGAGRVWWLDYLLCNSS